MLTEVEVERALLENMLLQHGPGIPPGAGAAIGAAADELDDPEQRPTIAAGSHDVGPDALVAVRQARARLTALAGTLPSVAASAACARAARHLGDAEHDLTTLWPGLPG